MLATGESTSPGDSSSTADATRSPPAASNVAGPPPPSYHDPRTWRLLSQGAEARVWLIPNFVSIGAVLGHSSSSSCPATSSSDVLSAVCKERFPKSYRHPSLDASITRGRTKGEARCLVRCRRAGVPCPAVLGVDVAKAPAGGTIDGEKRVGVIGNMGQQKIRRRLERSCCLFLEYVEGCTVREYFEVRSDHMVDEVDEVERDREEEGNSDGDKGNGGVEEFEGDDKDVEMEDMDAGRDNLCKNNGSEEKSTTSGPERKRARRSDGALATSGPKSGRYDSGKGGVQPKVKTTRVDDESILVARSIGRLVADMHGAGVVHGDLTTSNIMIRNPPPWPEPQTAGAGSDCRAPPSKRDGVDRATSGNRKPPPSSSCPAADAAEKVGAVKLEDDVKKEEKDENGGFDDLWSPDLCLIDLGLSCTAGSKGTSVEEKAVDLYVLERAFEATHPGSRRLVEEMLRSYAERGEGRDAEGQQEQAEKKQKGKKGGGKHQRQSVTSGVMSRLRAVRLRGRKRECFG